MKNIKAIIINKGWKIKDVAERWGLRADSLSKVAKKPKQIHIDAANGLPEKGE